MGFPSYVLSSILLVFPRSEDNKKLDPNAWERFVFQIADSNSENCYSKSGNFSVQSIQK